MTAAIRALLIVLAIFGFFLIGAPLQMLVARRAPQFGHVIPRLFCRTLLRLAKIELTVEGTPCAGPVLLVANHVSWIDILALRASAPVCFLAKDEIGRWPIISTFAAVQGTIFVDRTRRRSILPANRAMAARMAEGRPVLLFPEGTTSVGPEPGAFRSSHFAAAGLCLAEMPGAARVAVQPAGIVYSSPAAAWIGDDALLPHLWRVLRGPELACRLAFGAPIAVAPGDDRKAIARAARASSAALVAMRPASVPAEETARAAARRGAPATARGA